MSGLDTYYDHQAPTSRTALDAERARQRAEAAATGNSLDVIQQRDLTARITAERAADAATRAERDAAAAAALAQAQATHPAPPEGSPAGVYGVWRELVRRDAADGQGQALERARQAAAAARDRAQRWRTHVAEHPVVWRGDAGSVHGRTRVALDPDTIPAWFD